MEQIKAPTDMVWIIGRTQVNSKADGDKVVVPLQKQYKLTPLSAFGKVYTPPSPKPNPDVPKEDPNAILGKITAEEFFNRINKLMVENPPTTADAPAMEKFAKIGIGPGLKFSLASFTPEEQEAIRKIPEQVFAAMNEESKKGGNSLVNGWKLMPDNIANFGTDYMTRAFVAYYGLGANLREDAIYPACSYDADGNQLNGTNKYVLHFEKGKTPPAKAFWSLTMYDMEGYMVANPINRNAIGDRSNLKTNADGSIDIYFQNVSPGKDKESNWLPAPKGDFNVLLRVYWPKEEMLNGSWEAPAIKKI
jgi:DNA sulfur modification protein DndE